MNCGSDVNYVKLKIPVHNRRLLGAPDRKLIEETEYVKFKIPKNRQLLIKQKDNWSK